MHAGGCGGPEMPCAFKVLQLQRFESRVSWDAAGKLLAIMIVSHKFIFIKSKKTAGTSMEIALSRYCGDRDIITPIIPETKQELAEMGFKDAQNFKLTLPDSRSMALRCGFVVAPIHEHLQEMGLMTLIFPIGSHS